MKQFIYFPKKNFNRIEQTDAFDRYWTFYLIFQYIYCMQQKFLKKCNKNYNIPQENTREKPRIWHAHNGAVERRLEAVQS